MADVRRFRGLRYATSRAGDLARLVCPPYDVIAPPEAAALRAASAHNAIRLELPEATSRDDAGDGRYLRAAEALRAWRAQRILVRDDTPYVYAVEESFAWAGVKYQRRGILAAVRLVDWSERDVLPHERTLAAPKADRLELLRACSTNVSPIFMLCPPRPAAEARLWNALIAQPPAEQFTLDDGRATRVWLVTDAARELLDELAPSPLYIADGHHRYETALRYRDERRSPGAVASSASYEFVMTYLVSMADPGLLVLPTHRVVPVGRSGRHELDALLEERFSARTVSVPIGDRAAMDDQMRVLASLGRSRTAFALYRPGQLTFLTPRPDAERWMPQERHAAWRALDTAQLESLLLLPLVGTEAAEVLGYTRDPAEAVAAVDRGEAAFSVLLNPLPAEAIAAVADVGERMPQKSTYFYPKLSTGLVFHVLDDVAVV
jgi:uncharacterized protein (DUF1015 family)